MHRLDRRDVIEIAASSLPDGQVTDVDAVWTASTGHPLALAYLLKRLALASGADARRALLDATQPFGGEIERDGTVARLGVETFLTAERPGLW